MEGTTQKNNFYANSYRSLMIILMVEIILVLILVALVMYQIFHRPLPPFLAIAPNNQKMELTASYEPNLLPNTLITWASKAAVAAYTFDFANYASQIAFARPYFTESGWNNYQGALNRLIESIKQKQLLVNGVVAGPPVISNQGDLPGRGLTWRIQIPFLVTYQSAGPELRSRYIVAITIVRVPTSQNPTGIGIDQFVMATPTL